jgi:hypothetical protein
VEGNNCGLVLGNPRILLERLCKTTEQSVDTATLHLDIWNWWFQISIRCANQSLTEFILFFIVEVIGKREIFRRFADAVSCNRQSCLRIQPPASKCDGSGG